MIVILFVGRFLSDYSVYMMKKIIVFCIFITFAAYGVSADTVKINKTGTIYENVKTSVEGSVVKVSFEDGNEKKFRSKDVTVTSAEVVWLASQPEDESNKSSSWFGGSKSSDTSKASGEESEKSSIPYLGEGIFGSVALLFFLLP